MSDPEIPGNPPLFHVVMHEPEIPNNTGNIGRTCIATGCALHLVRPLGFETNEKALRRAGLDYWPRLAVREHEDWAGFMGWWEEALGTRHQAQGEASGTGDRASGRQERAGRIFLTSGLGGVTPWQADLRPGDAIVFGKETRGLPEEMLDGWPRERVLMLPMVAGERGLNVATAVCALVYEGIRQCAARGEVVVGTDGRMRRKALGTRH